MSRFQNVEDIYSVLFVDFDNIYSRLSEVAPVLSRTFATNPQRWLRWLEGHALRMIYGDGVRRRILKRICYINPARFQDFRLFFIRSAFQVVDCPPLTQNGKTSADIHLVIDCLDALSHATRFDEFIILSGDADFTPLLLRIQEYARRSLVLSVGYTSPAYAAACSWRIREDWFLSQALDDSREDERESHGEREGHRNGNTHVNQQEERIRRDFLAQEEIPEVALSSEKNIPVNLPAYERIHLVEAVKQLVAESSVPVPLPSVAQVLQNEQKASPDWYGAGTLRDLLNALDLAPVVFSPEDSGYVLDPKRHALPSGTEQHDPSRSFCPGGIGVYEFAQKAHKLADLPLLSSMHYNILFSMLAEEINAKGFSRVKTMQNIDERCENTNLPINAMQIAFVLEAVAKGGLNLANATKSKERLASEKIRRAFTKTAGELCKNAQIDMGKKEISMLNEWLNAPAAGSEVVV